MLNRFRKLLTSSTKTIAIIIVIIIAFVKLPHATISLHKIIIIVFCEKVFVFESYQDGGFPLYKWTYNHCA